MVHALFELLLHEGLDELNERDAFLELSNEVGFTFSQPLDASVELSDRVGDEHRLYRDEYYHQNRQAAVDHEYGHREEDNLDRVRDEHHSLVCQQHLYARHICLSRI